MPEMDGIEATEKIIETFKEKAPDIVALTANAFLEDKEKCFEAGMVDFVSKPIKRKEIIRVLQKYSKPLNNESNT
jgi:CheY-like chemotaxis protein